MNKILETFKKPRVLLPVVHAISSTQAKKQARLAMEHGADGIFIINQGGLDARAVMLETDWLTRTGAPFVGVNLLGVPAPTVARWCAKCRLAAIWSDRADLTREDRATVGWDGLFFGGVAFKYQAAVEDVGAAALDAVRAGVDVVTTSGPATGQPPTVEKVAAMRAAIGDHALAIASGITPENVEAFLPYVDAFLVATGIEERFGVFDPGRVRALADAIHGWRS